MRTLALALAPLIFSALVPAGALADTALRFRDDQGAESSIYVRAGAVLLDAGTSGVLRRPGEPGLTVLQHDQRQYMVLDQAAQARMGQHTGQAQTQMQQAMEQMRQQLAHVPPEQRAMIERMMAGQAQQAAPSTLGSRSLRREAADRVGAWQCQRFTALEGGQPKQELCVVAPAMLGMSPGDYDALVGAMEEMQAMAGRMSGRGSNVVADLRALGGVPVQIRDLESGRVTTLQAHSSAPLPSDRVAIPAGYQRRSLF